jgi:hypothetical protein
MGHIRATCDRNLRAAGRRGSGSLPLIALGGRRWSVVVGHLAGSKTVVEAAVGTDLLAVEQTFDPAGLGPTGRAAVTSVLSPVFE